jgi:hypothetical protein
MAKPNPTEVQDEAQEAGKTAKPQEASTTPGQKASTAGADAANKSAQGGQSGQGQNGQAAASGQTQSAIELLKADHRKAEALFNEFENAEDQRKVEIVKEACMALTIHTIIEEEIFYPACREAAEGKEQDEESLDEAQVEHDSAKLLIADLMRPRRNDEFRDAKFKVLAEQIKHHVKEEEAPGKGVFAKAKAAGADTPDLANRLQARKTQLEQRGGRLNPSRMVAIQDQAANRQQQENDMPRQQGPERDERGRFMSDDDDRGYRSRGESRSFRDDRSGRDRDSQGRFTRDDDDDRGYRSRSGGGGRGQGGWFGDSEGHSEAAREGWENRGRGRSRDDDDDDRGYRSRSSSSGGGRDRGQGGWFGDSEGHSEAAREGWENRGRGRSRDDDDDRGYRSRSSGGGGRDRGQGGWFGDSEGHSEASRRGWEDRR